MPITLAQAKVGMANHVDQQVIDQFRRGSMLLEALTFDNSVSPGTGGSTLTYGYTQLKTPAGADFRDINTDYTDTVADRETKSVDLKIFGGTFKIDRVLANTANGQINEVQFQLEEHIKATTNLFHYTAINGDKRIRFHYTGYDGHGRRVLRRGGTWYDVSPYALLWDDENYYLIGYDSAFSEIRHFRVDKISDLCTAGDGREGGKAFAALDMSAYTSAHFGMFSGTPENIRLECRDTLAGAVIDRFGTDTMLIPSREGYFTVTVPVAVSAPFFGWLCSFGGDIKLLAPESAVDALREHLRKFAEAYQI